MNAIINQGKAAGESWDSKLNSDGWVASDGGSAPVVEPATGAVLGRGGVGSPAGVARPVGSAPTAQNEWA